MAADGSDNARAAPRSTAVGIEVNGDLDKTVVVVSVVSVLACRNDVRGRDTVVVAGENAWHPNSERSARVATSSELKPEIG